MCMRIKKGWGSHTSTMEQQKGQYDFSGKRVLVTGAGKGEQTTAQDSRCIEPCCRDWTRNSVDPGEVWCRGGSLEQNCIRFEDT